MSYNNRTLIDLLADLRRNFDVLMPKLLDPHRNLTEWAFAGMTWARAMKNALHDKVLCNNVKWFSRHELFDYTVPNSLLLVHNDRDINACMMSFRTTFTMLKDLFEQKKAVLSSADANVWNDRIAMVEVLINQGVGQHFGISRQAKLVSPLQLHHTYKVWCKELKHKVAPTLLDTQLNQDCAYAGVQWMRCMLHELSQPQPADNLVMWASTDLKGLPLPNQLYVSHASADVHQWVTKMKEAVAHLVGEYSRLAHTPAADLVRLKNIAFLLKQIVYVPKEDTWFCVNVDV